MSFIPRDFILIDSCAGQISQSSWAEGTKIQLQEVSHERLHGITRKVLELLDPSFESSQIVSGVEIRLELEETLQFVVGQIG